MRTLVRALVLLGVLLAGCQAPGGVDRPAGPVVELTAVPFFAQDTDQCGPAALASVLTYAGVPITPEAARAAVYLPGRGGAVQPEMSAAIRRHGRVPLAMPTTFETLYTELRAGRPVLVFQNLGFDFAPIWHYAVLVGYDPATDDVILRSGTRERLVTSRRHFLRTWERGQRWALGVLPPATIPEWVLADAYLLSIAALESTGQLDAAAASYRAATLRWPDAPNAWLGVGNVAYARGDLPAASAAYRQALIVDARHLVARNNLAHTLGEAGCPAQGLALLDAVSSTPLLAATRAELERMPGVPGACSDDDAEPGRDG